MMNGAIRTTPAIRCMIGGMHRRSIPTIRSSSCKCKNNNHDALSSYYRYRSSTTKSKSEVSENPPTAKQLTMHALRIAVPMIGKLHIYDISTSSIICILFLCKSIHRTFSITHVSFCTIISLHSR